MTATLHQLPPTGLAPNNAEVARTLRQFATWVEEGSYGDVRTAILLIEPTTGHMQHSCCGQKTDFARIVGLLEFAKARLMAGMEE